MKFEKRFFFQFIKLDLKLFSLLQIIDITLSTSKYQTRSTIFNKEKSHFN